MCARLLKERGEGAKKTWMERVIGSIENACWRCMEDRSGGSCAPLDLDGDLDCVFSRNGGLFMVVPKSVSATRRQQRHLWALYRT
jgi:hypothetical protein